MDGNTQTGCNLGRLEQYRKNGKTIDEAYNDENGEELEFYVIKNTICPWDRSKEWGAKYKDDWFRHAKKEIVGRMLDLVIYIDQDIDLDMVLSDVAKQELAPAKLHLIVRGGIKPSYVYYKALNKAGYGFTTFPYELHYITNPELSVDDCLNMVGDKCGSYYYAVFFNDFYITHDFVSSVYTRSYGQMKPFILSRPLDGKSGLIVNSAAHRSVGGFSTKTVEEKLLERSEEQNLSHLIITYEDLFSREEA
jgi:hypothetical protein